MTDPAPQRRAYRAGARERASQETRKRILDALHAALLVKDLEAITLDQLAQEAGTTRQTLLVMFGSKDGLFEAFGQKTAAEIHARRLAPTGGDPRSLAHAVISDLDAVGDLVVRLLAQEQRLPAIADLLAQGRQGHLESLRVEFAPHLAGLSPEVAETILLEIRAVTDTLFWKVLRRDLKLSSQAAEDLLTDLLEKILAPASSRSATKHTSRFSSSARET